MGALRRCVSSVLGLGTLLVLNPACSDQGPGVADCSALPIGVTSGTVPSFSWDPGCRIAGLFVALPGPGAIVWTAVSVDQTNSIASPVDYASTPAGAAMTANLVQYLVAGTTYQVILFRVADGRGGQLQAVGTATFTP
jgi:hypothetical protein